MKKRLLTEILPSATEIEDFQTCPFKWFMRWRQGVRRAEGGIYLIAGAAVSDAIEAFYMGNGKQPLAVYDAKMEEQRNANPTIAEEEFQLVTALYREVLELYINERKPLWDGWKRVISAQAWIDFPARMKLDLAVEEDTGEVVVIEQKVISPFKDLSYENLKYEMGFQPISYAEGATRKFGVEVNKVVIDYMVRGAAARGRYKAISPRLDCHTVYVPTWKKLMWLNSVEFANRCMQAIEKEMEVQEEMHLVDIPRFTKNCIIQLGAKTYPCDYYAACSVNMNPMDVTGAFEKEE